MVIIGKYVEEILFENKQHLIDSMKKCVAKVCISQYHWYGTGLKVVQNFDSDTDIYVILKENAMCTTSKDNDKYCYTKESSYSYPKYNSGINLGNNKKIIVKLVIYLNHIQNIYLGMFHMVKQLRCNNLINRQPFPNKVNHTGCNNVNALTVKEVIELGFLPKNHINANNVKNYRF